MTSCIVCESPAEQFMPYGSYRIRRCSACGLQFSDPMAGTTSNYPAAYDAQGAPAEVAGEGLPYLGWTEEASRDLKEFAPFLTTAQEFALQFLRQRFSGKQLLPALDIGFGAGWFLGALQAAGFSSYGLEVADAPVNALQSKGFMACKGRNSAVPQEWPAPSLITAFEVLEHLEDPVGFLAELCRAHPQADVMLSVPDERRWFLLGGREEHDYPPNHLTRWSPMSLNLALRRAGFQHARVWRLRPSAQELSMASVRRFFRLRKPASTFKGPAAPTTTLAEELRKRKLRKKLFQPLAVLLPLIGRTACSMVAFAANREPA